MNRTEQRYVMKFLFMDGRKYKAIHTELSRVLKGHVVSVDVCKYWCRKFKADDCSMDDRVRPERPQIELSGAIISLLSNEPFLSARVLAVRRSSTHQTIKRVLLSDLGIAKVREMMDTTWFEWNQSKRTSSQSKFASERALSWWRKWIREHNE
jgi:hypothetical protein